MKIKQILATAAFTLMAAAATPTAASAQSVDEGAKMVRYERYETAKKILTPLAATDARAAYYLGLAELGLENKAAAEAAFKRYPEDVANMTGLARIAFLNNNRAEGERILNAVAEKTRKKDVEPARFAADAWNYSGAGPTQAVELYNLYLQRNDDNAVRVSLGDAYAKISGGAGNAVTAYQKVTERDPSNSLAYSRMGAIWYSAKKYDSALANYNRAKDADPQNPLPYRDLANAYFYVGKYDLAKQNADKYYELSDKTPEDKIQKANLEFLTKNYDAAIGSMQDLLQSGEGKPYMHRVIGYSQYEKANYQEAHDAMKTFFAKQDPAKILPSDYLYLGLSQMQLKQTDSAEATLNKAISLDTTRNKAEVYRRIADGMKDAKDYARSAKWYGRLIADSVATDPTATDWFWWGVMHYYARDYETAAPIFTAMEAKFPTVALATYWRGRVAAAQDQDAKTGGAVPHYTKWLGMEDTDTYTKKDSDLMQAYQYLALYYYNKNDRANTDKYLLLIEKIEPDNKMLKQIRDAQK